MTLKDNLLLFSLLMFIGACSPTINYLGDSYAPTQEVDVYFDEPDIKRDYKVMGVMKNEGGEFEMDDPETVKTKMIQKAKSVGADAILFLGIYHDKVNDSWDGTMTTSKVYEAKLLKYKE